MAFRVQIRRDTALNWATNNPILLDGEFGYETDTGSAKLLARAMIPTAWTR